MKRVLVYPLLICGFLVTACAEQESPKMKGISISTIEVLSNVLPAGLYTSVHMVSATTGYSTSDEGKIYKTTDGGYTWSEQVSGTTLVLRDIYFEDEITGFIVGGSTEGVILKTVNGGESWELRSVSAINGLSAIHFVNTTTGFCVGTGSLLRTMDGGETWNKIELPKHYIMDDINFFDERVGLIGADPASLRTFDGGLTWSEIKNHDVRGEIQIIGSTTAFLHNSYSVYKTKDSGKSWTTISDLPSITAVHFFNQNNAIALGYRYQGFYPTALVYLTSDKFNSWDETISETEDFFKLNDISFMTDSTALAVGETTKGCVLQLKFSNTQ